MRTHYAHPVDALRKFNPQMTINTLEQEDFVGVDDLERVLSTIEGVEATFDSLTGNPMRRVRVGDPERPESWEVQSASLTNQGGIKVWLDNKHIAPLDGAEGDALEIRTGRRSWRDVTDAANRYDLNGRKGYVRFFTRYTRSFWRKALRDEAVRICYRHGAQGGSRTEAYETTLEATALPSEDTMDISGSSGLHRGAILKVGDEYVSVTSASDPVGVARGVRGTTASEHSAGEAVSYVPLDVREAVAAKAAVELMSWADWTNELVDADGMRVSDKVEKWEARWNEALEKRSEVRHL